MYKDIFLSFLKLPPAIAALTLLTSLTPLLHNAEFAFIGVTALSLYLLPRYTVNNVCANSVAYFILVRPVYRMVLMFYFVSLFSQLENANGLSPCLSELTLSD